MFRRFRCRHEVPRCEGGADSTGIRQRIQLRWLGELLDVTWRAV
jgi:hypothetical protein